MRKNNRTSRVCYKKSFNSRTKSKTKFKRHCRRNNKFTLKKNKKRFLRKNKYGGNPPVIIL